MSAIVIGGFAVGRRASAQAPDEGFIVPPDSELSDDEFIIWPDTDLIGLPVIGLPGGGMMLGGPTVQIVHPDGRNWAYSVEGAPLTAAGVPSGGTYTWSASGAGSATFNPQGSTYASTTMSVTEPGSYTPRVVYTKSGQSANAQRGTIVALEADLQMDGLDEAQEEDPGGYLGVGGPRRKVTLNYAPSQPLQYHQLGVYPTYGLEIYACETGGEPVTVLSWDDRPPPQGQNNWAQRPSELWVEGKTVSSAPRQEAVTLGYTGWAEANVGSDNDTVVVTVVDVNLELQGVTEEHEEDPGGFLALNNDDDDSDQVVDKDDVNGVANENDMVHLVVQQVLPNTLPPTDKVKLTWAPDAKVDVFENPNKTGPVDSGKEYTLSQLPKTLYVEGDEVSGGLHDVQFDLSYTKGASTVTDTVKLTVVGIEKLPLGGYASLSSFVIGKVYIPTKYGGVLSISPSACKLYYTDGSDLSIETALAIAKGSFEDKALTPDEPGVWTIPKDRFKWHYVKMSSDTIGYAADAFLQSARASKSPWNCPWYPISDERAPNLYDADGCLDKYDRAYDTHARHMEKRSFVFVGGHYVAQNALLESDAERTVGYDIDNADGDGDVWTGWDPNVPYDFWNSQSNPPDWGQDGDTMDSVDASWYGHCGPQTAVVILETEPTGNFQAPNGVVFTPADKKGLLVALYHGYLFEPESEKVDVKASEWHSRLESWIIAEGRMFGCDTFNSGTGPDTVWNYPVYEIKEAWYSERSGQSNERAIQIDCHVNKWDWGESTEHYVYWVTYGVDGTATTPDGWVTQESGRPDIVWLPQRHISVDAFWEGELDLETIRDIIPLP
jgi:hypothetical protein